MAKINLRKLSDNEISYLKFGNLASPFFLVFLELKLKKRQTLTIDSIDKVLQKTMDLYDELNIVASGKKFIFQKNTAKVTAVKNDFDGYNFEVLLGAFVGMEPVQLYFVNGRYLAFRFNHAYIDGGGALMFIDSFLDCMLGKKKKNKTNSYISDLDYIRKIDHVKHRRSLSFKNTLSIKPTRGNNNVYYKRLTIDKKIPFLLSKIIVAMNDYFKNGNLTYLLPTSIRKARPEIVSISNLTEILYLKCNKNDDWLTISRKIHNGISEGDNLNIKNVDYGLIMDLPASFYRGLIKISTSISRKTGRFLTAGNITSITHHFDKFDNPIFAVESVFLLPFYQPLVPYSINIMETKDKTEIVFCSNNNYINKDLANSILNRIGKLVSDERLYNTHK